MGPTTDKLNAAIRAQKGREVSRLLTLAEQNRALLVEWDEQPLQEALATRNLDILERVARYPWWRGTVLAEGYAQAVEKGWSAEAAVLLHAGSHRSGYQQLHLVDVLRFAARCGWLNTIDQVLTQDPHLLSTLPPTPLNPHENPLVVALAAKQRPAFHRLLKERLAEHVLAQALDQAIFDDQAEMFPLLWPRVRDSDRSTAIGRMAHYRSDQSLDWLLRTFSPQAIRDQCSPDPIARLDALIQSAQNSRLDMVQVLLPLVDPKQEKSCALRVAVQQDHPAIIALLLPLSDPKVARSVWLRATPPRWNHVDRLGLYLPPEQKKAWLNRPEQMPQMVAAQRAAQSSLTPPPTPGRRRWRS